MVLFFENESEQLCVHSATAGDYLTPDELAKCLPDFVHFTDVFFHDQLAVDLLLVVLDLLGYGQLGQI